MTPTWPREQLTAWRTARRHCPPACFAYHATWPLVRGVGIKASPAWHRDFYLAQMKSKGLLRTGGTVDVLVAGAADTTLPALLAGIIGSEQTHLTVIDQCPTPIELTRRWAYTHPALKLDTHTACVQDLTASADFDLAVTDGLLSLQPDPAGRHAVLERLAAALRPNGTLLYTTRITAHPALEYDRTGRIIQTAAALTWPHSEPTRRQTATERWYRPARHAANQTAGELADDLGVHFDQVDTTTDRWPPTTLLRLHPHTSHIIRAVASRPTRHRS